MRGSTLIAKAVFRSTLQLANFTYTVYPIDWKLMVCVVGRLYIAAYVSHKV